MRKFVITVFTVMILCVTAADCSAASADTENAGPVLPHRFADREEGTELMMACEEYFDGFSANDLAYRMQDPDATIEEYKAFAEEQVLDFTDEERALIDEYMRKLGQKLADNCYHLPALDEIVFVCTTMREEGGATAYTHGTQIYIGKEPLDSIVSGGIYDPLFECILAHEVFHCLTRNSPGFRADMYNIIHFIVQDEDFTIPPSVMEYYISNPDVEHHNTYAGFVIGGEPVDCFMALVTGKHFEEEGDRFFDTAVPVLVPVDGTDVFYYPEDTANFDAVLGKNTGYTIDPEECMADNFAFTVVYGMDGPDGDGYETPEIIEAVMAYLKQ